MVVALYLPDSRLRELTCLRGAGFSDFSLSYFARALSNTEWALMGSNFFAMVFGAIFFRMSLTSPLYYASFCRTEVNWNNSVSFLSLYQEVQGRAFSVWNM